MEPDEEIAADVPLPSPTMPGLIEGRIVHFVLPNGCHRPAIVLESWHSNPGGTVNLLVFLDGTNDHGAKSYSYFDEQYLAWRPSVPFSEEPKPRTWHWIERA